MAAPRLDKLDKNYIINGNFDFWQRGTVSAISGTGSNTGYFAADRIQFSANTTNNRANRQTARSTDVPTLLESGFRSTYSFEYSQTSALVLAAGDYLTACNQPVEGIFYRNLHGKKMTLSFWFKSTLAGQYPVGFENAAFNRSYVTLFTYDVANVWQKIYITLDTDAGGVWNFDNSRGIGIYICTSAGSTYQAPSLNTWLTGNYFATASGVQIQAQTTITWKIAQLQLVEGDIQTGSFSMAGRDYAEEFRLCQRYYETSGDMAASTPLLGRRFNWSGAGHEVWFHDTFRVIKRAGPIATIRRDINDAASANIPSGYYAGLESITHYEILAAGAYMDISGWTADAEL